MDGINPPSNRSPWSFDPSPTPTDDHDDLQPIVGGVSTPSASIDQQGNFQPVTAPTTPVSTEPSWSQLGVISSPVTPISTEEVSIEPQTTVASFDNSSGVITNSAVEPTADISEKVSYDGSAIQEIELAKVVPNPYQPRKVFKPEALQELAASIKEHGVIQPIVVTETPSGYELVVGERRFRASQLAGLVKVPAIIKHTLHDQTKLEVALIENIQRQELNAIEEAQAYDRLIKVFKMTQDQVAKKVGKSRPAIANTLRLLNLPAEIQRGVSEGKISEGHARAILGVSEIEKQILLYQTILEQGWSVRQVEAKVREMALKKRVDAATPDPKLMAIESELRGKLGAQVKIQRQGRGGKIMIEFFSDEDLEEILNKIAEQKSAGNDYFTV